MPRTLPYVAQAKTGVRVYFVAAIWLLVSALTSIGTAQTSSQQQTDAGRRQSTVHGRVIYEDTRRPLRRVAVTIYDPAAKSNTRHLMAWTDGRGEFQIKDVPAGKYFVVIDAPGIVRSGPYDSEEEKRKALASVTVDGTSDPEVSVRVRRGAAISGRVTYADGDPAINTSLRVLRKQGGKWTPVYVGVGSNDRVLTDDRGVYRVSGLLPGEYLVGAAEEKWGIELTARNQPDGINLLNRGLLTTTFYDGATSLTGATVLTIQAGDEQKDINITLADLPVHSISGTVTFKGNTRPISRARMSLKRKDENPAALSDDLQDPVMNTDEKGRFTFDEVQDGNYTISITPPRWYSRSEDFPTASQMADAGQRFVGRNLEVTVAGADLADLIVEVSGGSRISGAVAVEGGKPLPRNVLVYAAAIEGRQAQSSSPIRVQADGTFSLDGVSSGVTYMRTSVPPDNQYYTKSVTVGKTELLRGSLVVKEDEDITNVRIVISPDVALLSGRVLAPDGKTPLPGSSVGLISTDPDQQKSTNARIFGFTNADGNFRLSGAPGEYLAIVMRPGEFVYELSNDALKLHNPNAQRIVLQPGENNRVEIIAPGNK
jgi:Carboxypeptidase regulatory-like domain